MPRSGTTSRPGARPVPDAGETLLTLDPAHGTTKRAQLIGALRAAVREGRFRPGDALPSTRSLAGELGVGRNVVVEAYDQLVAEGYLVSRQGSGTRVADEARAGRHAPPRDRANRPPARYDLLPGTPDLSLFPRQAWLGAVRSVLAELPDAELGYIDPTGVGALRAETAAYLGRSRGVDAGPDDLVITAAFSHGLWIVLQVLAQLGIRHLAVEDPGGHRIRDLLAAAGVTPVPVPVDEDGLDVAALAASDARAVLVTPAHQYPMGVALSPERRTALVAWAREVDGWVLEDDYDSEFRYDREPLGAVQGLDPDRVLHAGTVSKSLAPGLRLGSLVVPDDLQERVFHHLASVHSRTPAIDQYAFARFVASGAHDRHLRRARAAYRDKRDLVLEVLGPVAHLDGIAAGLHVVVRLPEGFDEAETVARLAERDVAVERLRDYCVVAEPPPSIVVGYGGRSLPDLRRALDVIATVLAPA